LRPAPGRKRQDRFSGTKRAAQKTGAAGDDRRKPGTVIGRFEFASRITLAGARQSAYLSGSRKALDRGGQAMVASLAART